MIDLVAEPPAVFDAGAVRRLAGDVEDAAFATAFVATYRRLLPERVRRIAAALEDGDPEAAMDATLSLKVSSATVGAEELFGLARIVEAQLRRSGTAAATSKAAELPAAAARAHQALGAYLAP
jgi:HPt (histidine-containing phosphotransfer) domain-containing protein